LTSTANNRTHIDPLAGEAERKRETRIIFAVLLAAQLFCALAANALSHRDMLCSEAVIRSGVGMDLLAGDVKGRQGLVGSLYWTPMPTLFMLPFLSVLKAGALCVVAAAAAALSGAFLNSWLGRCGVPRSSRFAVIVLYEINPALLGSVITGSSAVLFSLLMFAALAYLLDWLDNDSLHSLAGLAIAAGLAILTRYQSVVLVVVFLVLITSVLVVRRRAKGYVEGLLTACIVPPAYALAVWFAANWLIMGDALFFLRGLLPSRHAGAGVHELLREGCPWAAALLPMLIVAVAWMARKNNGRPSRAGIILLAVCVAGLGVGLLFGTGESSESKELDDIARYLAARHPDDRVVVAGYMGYELVRRLPHERKKIIFHTLSIYMDTVLKRTRGKRLYILIPRPTGAGRWEDINLKFPGIYTRGTDFTIFKKQWPNWCMLRVVRTDQPADAG